MRKIFSIFLVLGVLSLFIVAASALDIEGSSSSVPPDDRVSAGQVVTAYVFIMFRADFSNDTKLGFTTDLENAQWNYSVYIVNTPTFYPDWYARPLVSGKMLVVNGFNNGTDYIDGVKTVVRGTVPAGTAGSKVVFLNAGLADAKAGKTLDAPFEINRTLGSGTPGSLQTTSTPAPVISRISTGNPAAPVKPPATKSPIAMSLGFAALALAAVLSIGWGKTRG
jgi:hypothetical protein